MITIIGTITCHKLTISRIIPIISSDILLISRWNVYIDWCRIIRLLYCFIWSSIPMIVIRLGLIVRRSGKLFNIWLIDICIVLIRLMWLWLTASHWFASIWLTVKYRLNISVSRENFKLKYILPETLIYWVRLSR